MTKARPRSLEPTAGVRHVCAPAPASTRLRRSACPWCETLQCRRPVLGSFFVCLPIGQDFACLHTVNIVLNDIVEGQEATPTRDVRGWRLSGKQQKGETMKDSIKIPSLGAIATILTGILIGGPAFAGKDDFYNPPTSASDPAIAGSDTGAITALTGRNSLDCRTSTFPGDDRLAEMPNSTLAFNQSGSIPRSVVVTFVGSWPTPTVSDGDLPSGSAAAGAIIFLTIDGQRVDQVSNGGGRTGARRLRSVVERNPWFYLRNGANLSWGTRGQVPLEQQLSKWLWHRVCVRTHHSCRTLQMRTSLRHWGRPPERRQIRWQNSQQGRNTNVQSLAVLARSEG